MSESGLVSQYALMNEPNASLATESLLHDFSMQLFPWILISDTQYNILNCSGKILYPLTLNIKLIDTLPVI